MAGTGSGDGELFKAPRAQLYLVEEGENSVLMESGQFALMLVKNPVSQLAAVLAMVGEVQWPVGRDSNVVRGDEGSFTFMLPGSLTYKLVLASSSADLLKLEHVLLEYSDCQKRPAEQQSQQNLEPREAREQQPEQSPLASDSRKRAIDSTSSQLTRRMLRARRMSAVAKVFSKSLERGAIDAASHVEPMNTAASLRQIRPRLALASVDAIARVVEAVETNGRSLLESAALVAAGVASQEQKDKQGSASTSSDSTLNMLIKSGWTLNKLGLFMLFRVISASMAIHSGGSSSGGSSRSGSSSSSEFQRLLSSSSSSSSFSSRSPSTPSHAQSGGTSTDVTSSTLSLQSPPVVVTTVPSSMPVLPPPPLFSNSAPRIRHPHMPPPSAPLPAPMAGPPSQSAIASKDTQGSAPFRIYKPRPTPAAPTATVTPPPPPFVPRPPRFHHPRKG